MVSLTALRCQAPVCSKNVPLFTVRERASQTGNTGSPKFNISRLAQAKIEMA